jgi:hypothetical protein
MTLATLGIRGPSFEERYVAPFTVFFALFGVLGCWRMWQLARTRPRRVIAGAIIVAVRASLFHYV